MRLCDFVFFIYIYIYFFFIIDRFEMSSKPLYKLLKAFLAKKPELSTLLSNFYGVSQNGSAMYELMNRNE